MVTLMMFVLIPLVLIVLNFKSLSKINRQKLLNVLIRNIPGNVRRTKWLRRNGTKYILLDFEGIH